MRKLACDLVPVCDGHKIFFMCFWLTWCEQVWQNKKEEKLNGKWIKIFQNFSRHS